MAGDNQVSGPAARRRARVPLTFRKPRPWNKENGRIAKTAGNAARGCNSYLDKQRAAVEAALSIPSRCRPQPFDLLCDQKLTIRPRAPSGRPRVE
jgi:hypothetical protein